MDPKLLFWTAALVDLGALCGFALLGVRYARRGEIARHQRAMKIASLLVIAFLVSYMFKLVILGREDMSVWSELDVWVLRIHEVFVLQMVVAGIVAWLKSRRLLGTRLVTHEASDPLPDAKDVRIHRIAGRISVIGALLGFLMAIGVLIGMFVRAGAGT
jgi:uncharacterized membrane protein YozB (DUF420 family)